MVIDHGRHGHPVRLRAPDGEFLISAKGYVTEGHLSVLETYLAKQGYYFTIVRVGVGTGSEAERVLVP